MLPSSVSSASDHSLAVFTADGFGVSVGALWIEHQGTNQAQERDLFGTSRAAEERTDFDIRYLAAFTLRVGVQFGMSVSCRASSLRRPTSP